MLIVIALIVFMLTAVLVPLATSLLIRKGIVDQPIARSSHEIPTPRGGGLVVMPVILGAWFLLVSFGVFHWPDFKNCMAVILCGLILCGFTWLDDITPGGLRVRTRLAVQILAVIIPLVFWPLEAGRLLPDAVPLLVERGLMALAWLWFLNLYNFMDGINGISGAQAISISGGLLIFCFFSDVHVPPGYVEMLVVPLAAAAGFLVWNGRRVAKIFLGDVGSIGFGYCLAWLLFIFAANNYLVPAILVSLVYSVDASATLLKRIWQRKKIWEAAREHYYHRATVKGALSHLQCVGLIVLVNLVLIALGLAVLHGVMMPVAGLVLGFVPVTALMVFFYWMGKKHGHVSSPRPPPFALETKIRNLFK